MNRERNFRPHRKDPDRRETRPGILESQPLELDERAAEERKTAPGDEALEESIDVVSAVAEIKGSLEEEASNSEREESECKIESQIVEVDGVEVTVTRYLPTGEAQEDKTPIVFVGGWSTEAESYQGALINMTEGGREVIFLNPVPSRKPRDEEKEVLRNMGHDRFMKEAKLPAVELSKAGITKDVLEELDIDEYYLAGHSQGGIVAMGVAEMMQEQVRGIALINAAGIARKRPWAMELLAQPVNMIHGMLLEKRLGKFRDDLVEAANERISQNRWAYMKEAVGAAATNLLPILRLHHAREGHAPVHMFWGQSDVGYPGKKMHRRVMAGGQSEKKVDADRDFYDAADTVSLFAHPDITKGEIPGKHSGDLMHGAIMNFPELATGLNQYFDSLDKENKD